MTAGEATEQVLGAQIALRNNRRLQAAMRSSRLPAVKTLAQFDFRPAVDLGQHAVDRFQRAGHLQVRQHRPQPVAPVTRRCRHPAASA